jgi:hypothetical protein
MRNWNYPQGKIKRKSYLSFLVKLQPTKCEFRLKIKVGNLPVAQWFGMRIAQSKNLEYLLLATIQNCTKSLEDERMSQDVRQVVLVHGKQGRFGMVLVQSRTSRFRALSSRAHQWLDFLEKLLLLHPVRTVGGREGDENEDLSWDSRLEGWIFKALVLMVRTSVAKIARPQNTTFLENSKTSPAARMIIIQTHGRKEIQS